VSRGQATGVGASCSGFRLYGLVQHAGARRHVADGIGWSGEVSVIETARCRAPSAVAGKRSRPGVAAVSRASPFQLQRAAETPVADARRTYDGHLDFIELACRGAAAWDRVLTTLQLQRSVIEIDTAHLFTVSAA
jgi:hypothetical protein